MPQTLSALPSLKLPGHRSRDTSPRRGSYPRRFALGQFPANESISLFPEINLRIPVGKLLAALTVLGFGALLIGHFSQVGAFLGSFIYNPANASISGDPIITGMVDWLPIVLVCLAIVVLGSLVMNRAKYRRELRQAGPRLVSRPTRQQTAFRPAEAPRTGKPLSEPVPAAAADPVPHPEELHKLFLVPQDRHEAQERVRLERDARASALARAAEAARLVISGRVRLHESEALVVPAPRRVLAPMPAPAPPRSGVFFPAVTASERKPISTKRPLPISASRPSLSRAPHTPPAIL